MELLGALDVYYTVVDEEEQSDKMYVNYHKERWQEKTVLPKVTLIQHRFATTKAPLGASRFNLTCYQPHSADPLTSRQSIYIHTLN